MIPIKKEPKDMYLDFRVYEHCLFCNKATNTWHLKSNTPICKECASIKGINDLPKKTLK